MKRLLSLAAAVLLGFGLSASAHADTLTINLANANQSGTAGTYSFTATITAPLGNSGSVDLISDELTVVAPSTADDSGFLNTPLSMSPGDTWTGVLFAIIIPSGAAPGNYFGTFSIKDGDSNTLGSADYSIAISAAQVGATPEPSSFILLGTGLAGGVAAFRRRYSI